MDRVDAYLAKHGPPDLTKVGTPLFKRVKGGFKLTAAAVRILKAVKWPN